MEVNRGILGRRYFSDLQQTHLKMIIAQLLQEFRDVSLRRHENVNMLGHDDLEMKHIAGFGGPQNRPLWPHPCLCVVG